MIARGGLSQLRTSAAAWASIGLLLALVHGCSGSDREFTPSSAQVGGGSGNAGDGAGSGNGGTGANAGNVGGDGGEPTGPSNRWNEGRWGEATFAP